MNDRHIDTSAEPDYLERFGLQRAPFATAPDADFFCADSTLTQRLDMLQHLAEFGMLLLLVIGAPGAGKTSVLQQFLRRAGSGWRVCHLDGHVVGNAHDLARDLATGFNIPGADLAQVSAHLDELNAQEQLAVLVVDDAECLPDAELRTLLELSGRPGQGNRRLSVVLFGAPGLPEKIAALSPAHADNTHTLTIPPLSELQTAAYLHHRFNVAGLAGESPLTPAQVKSLYKASRGIPAAINARAHQMLSDLHSVSGGVRAGSSSESSAPPAAGLTQKEKLKAWGAGMLAVALVVAFAVFIWPESVPQKAREAKAPPPAEEKVAGQPTEQTVELALPQVAEPPSDKGASGGQKTAKPEPYTAPLPQPTLGPQVDTPAAMSPAGKIEVSAVPAPEPPPGTVPAQAQAEAPPPAPAAAPVEPPPSAPTAAPPPAPEAAPTKPVAPEPAPASTPVPAKEPPAAKPPVVAKAEAPGASGNAWVKAQPAGHYTLQLLGASRESAVRGFIRQHDLKGEPAILHTRRAGKDWYVLIYGDYSNRGAASAAAAKLPAAVRAGKPWPRTFGSLQGDLQ